LVVTTLIDAPVAKAVLLAVALAAADFALSAAWAVPLDIAPDHAGVVTGWMNTLGNLGGLVGPLVVGFVVAEYQSWVIPLLPGGGNLRRRRRRLAGHRPKHSGGKPGAPRFRPLVAVVP